MIKYIKISILKFLNLLGFKKKFLVYPVFKENSYSQNGEDGIIEFILKKIPDIPHFVLDIGANDGVLYSNSRLLIKKYNFKGLLIEAYDKAFLRLEKLYEDNKNIMTCDKAVGAKDGEGIINWDGHFQNLKIDIYDINKLLKSYKIPKQIGILTIDIDGFDNEILRALEWDKFSPWIVIAEINSSRHQNLQRQIDIMEKNGYFPLYHIGNVFYIRKDISGKFLFKKRKSTLEFEKGLFWS